MARSGRNLRALGGASENATLAFDALSSQEFEAVPKSEKEAWFMSAAIHCDLSRLAVSLSECEPGVAKLLSMADLISKLYEIEKWYSGAGAKRLREIAAAKTCGTSLVDHTLKEMKALHPISKVDKYRIYRNKVGYHYDVNTPQYLQRFAKEDSDAFFALLLSFVRFSGEWASLTTKVVRAHAADA